MRIRGTRNGKRGTKSKVVSLAAQRKFTRLMAQLKAQEQRIREVWDVPGWERYGDL